MLDRRTDRVRLDMAQLRPTLSKRIFQQELDKQVRQCCRKMKVHEMTVRRADQPCSLHACLRHVLKLARWTGFFPVQGLGQTSADGTRKIQRSDPDFVGVQFPDQCSVKNTVECLDKSQFNSDIRRHSLFKIKSYYCCFYITTLIGLAVISCFSILFSFQNKVDLNTISNIIFCVTGFISAILLLKLSQQWPQLMAKATETEQSLTELKFEKKTVVQTTVIAYVVMTLALVEHILYTSFNIRFVMNCLQEPGITSNVMEYYVTHRLPYVFNYIPHTAFTAVVFEYIYLQATFLWSFNDVMVTCFSIYITAYFRNLNKVIAANVKKKKNGIPWSVLRVHYSNLVKLVKEIDVQISSFILIAFFTDLYYICLQLFNSLHRNHVTFNYCDEEHNSEALSSPFYLLYYLYSVIFLVLRTLMLSLFASNVHCISLEPAYSVCHIPSSVYDIEVRRFQLQLRHTNVGLSGKFFNVTRNMIGKVVGTIITYEIVLLQYSIPPETNYNGTTVATIFENITGVYGQI